MADTSGNDNVVFITPETKYGHDTHLFVDTEGMIRDHYLERLFEECYYGNPFDEVFKNNFTQYFGHLIEPGATIAGDVFHDPRAAQQWVSFALGPVQVREATDDDRELMEADEEHGKWIATIRCNFIEVDEACFAPTELHAILLTAVLVFRHWSQRHIERVYASANGMPA